MKMTPATSSQKPGPLAADPVEQGTSGLPAETWLQRLVLAPEQPQDLGLDDASTAASRVQWLCENLSKHRARYKDDELGQALWHLMGVGNEVWRTVAEGDDALVVATLLSLKTLYTTVFATLSFPADGSRDTDGDLESACYMLFDMDGGLSALYRSRGPRGDAACEVIKHALTLDSPICWYSGLHALGHAPRNQKKARYQAMIDAFVAARGGTLSPFFIDYARAARAGAVQ
jgi:hypothetical protein